MEYDIAVKFEHADEILIKFNETCITEKYKNLIKSNYQKQLPICRDYASYDIKKMLELATQAKDLLGWEWLSDHYDTEVSIRLHKDLEVFLSRGFENIPEKYDSILHELHICLHALEGNQSRNILQIEWFNNDGFDLPYEFVHTFSHTLGDIRLQNPYVGHIPWIVFGTNDHSNIAQTCKFHDFVKPGFCIKMYGPLETELTDFESSKQEYLDWFKKYSPDFYHTHGADKLIHYAGSARIGHTVNKEVLLHIRDLPNINFEHLRFNY